MLSKSLSSFYNKKTDNPRKVPRKENLGSHNIAAAADDDNDDNDDVDSAISIAIEMDQDYYKSTYALR